MEDANQSETSHLLAKSCPSKSLKTYFSSHEFALLDYITYHSDGDSSSENDRDRCINRSLNPTIGRRPSNPQRARSNSIAIFHEDEDDVIFTSYGPIVVEEETRGFRQILNHFHLF